MNNVVYAPPAFGDDDFLKDGSRHRWMHLNGEHAEESIRFPSKLAEETLYRIGKKGMGGQVSERAHVRNLLWSFVGECSGECREESVRFKLSKGARQSVATPLAYLEQKTTDLDSAANYRVTIVSDDDVGQSASSTSSYETYLNSTFVVDFAYGRKSRDSGKLYEAAVAGAIPIIVCSDKEKAQSFQGYTTPPPFAFVKTWEDAWETIEGYHGSLLRGKGEGRGGESQRFQVAEWYLKEINGIKSKTKVSIVVVVAARYCARGEQTR